MSRAMTGKSQIRPPRGRPLSGDRLVPAMTDIGAQRGPSIARCPKSAFTELLPYMPRLAFPVSGWLFPAGICPRDLALTGKIPGTSKPAGRWLFLVADLQRWVTRTNRIGKICPRTSINVAGSDGCVLRSRESSTARAYEHALKRPPKGG